MRLEAAETDGEWATVVRDWWDGRPLRAFFGASREESEGFAREWCESRGLCVGR